VVCRTAVLPQKHLPDEEHDLLEREIPTSQKRSSTVSTPTSFWCVPARLKIYEARALHSKTLKNGRTPHIDSQDASR
jgi:hypothetical protein